MIAQAKKVILLVDHSKFDKVSFTKTCNFKNISMLITNKAPNLDWQNYLEENEINLIY